VLGIRRNACSCLVISFQFDSSAAFWPLGDASCLVDAHWCCAFRMGCCSQIYIFDKNCSEVDCACPCRIIYGLPWNGWYAGSIRVMLLLCWLLESNTGVAAQKLLILWVQEYLIACLTTLSLPCELGKQSVDGKYFVVKIWCIEPSYLWTSGCRENLELVWHVWVVSNLLAAFQDTLNWYGMCFSEMSSGSLLLMLNVNHLKASTMYYIHDGRLLSHCQNNTV